MATGLRLAHDHRDLDYLAQGCGQHVSGYVNLTEPVGGSIVSGYRRKHAVEQHAVVRPIEFDLDAAAWPPQPGPVDLDHADLVDHLPRNLGPTPRRKLNDQMVLVDLKFPFRNSEEKHPKQQQERRNKT